MSLVFDDLQEITLPNGDAVSEVIIPGGNVVWRSFIPMLTGVSLSTSSFTGNDAIVESINVQGSRMTEFNISVIVVSGGNWISNANLSASTSTIGNDGTDSTVTVTLPAAQDDTFSRSFKIRVEYVDDSTIFAESPVLTQVHTQSTAAGNLVVGVDAVYSTPNIDFYTNITQGDAPFEIVLNNHATDKTVNPIHTINLSELHETIDASTGDAQWVSDSSEGGDGNTYRWRVTYRQSAGLVSAVVGDNIYEDNFDHTGAVFAITDNVILRIAGIEPTHVPVYYGDVIFALGSITGLDSFTLDPTLYESTYTRPNGDVRYFGNDPGVVVIEKTSSFRLNVGNAPDGDVTYYIHASDADGDVVVAMETIPIDNQPPTGMISQTQGSMTPANGDLVQLDANYTDVEGNSLSYSWQISEPGADLGLAENKSSLYTSTNSSWGQSGSVVILRDNGNDNTGGASGDRVFAGASASASGPGIIAFWNDGEDHARVEPFLTLEDNATSTSSNYGGNSTWIFDTLTTEQLVSIKAISENETATGGSSYYTVPEANWELWEGYNDIPTTEVFSDINASADVFTETVSNKALLAESTNTGWGQSGSKMILRDDGDDQLGGQNNDRIFLGASGAIAGGCTIAFWNTGEDHSSVLPSFVLFDTQDSFTSSNYGNNHIWRFERIPTDALNFLIGIGTGEHFNGTTRNWTIPEANWELWEGQQLEQPFGSSGPTYSFISNVAINNDLTPHPGGNTGVGTIEPIERSTTNPINWSGWNSQYTGDNFATNNVVLEFRDDDSDGFNGVSGDYLRWGSDEDRNAGSVVAVFANGANHVTDQPIFTHSDNREWPNSQDGWESGVGYFELTLNTNFDVPGNAQFSGSDNLGSPSGTYYGFDATRVEVWIGTQNVPTFRVSDQIGGYRCVVTATEGDLTPVNSNTITIS